MAGIAVASRVPGTETRGLLGVGRALWGARAAEMAIKSEVASGVSLPPLYPSRKRRLVEGENEVCGGVGAPGVGGGGCSGGEDEMCGWVGALGVGGGGCSGGWSGCWEAWAWMKPSSSWMRV